METLPFNWDSELSKMINVLLQSTKKREFLVSSLIAIGKAWNFDKHDFNDASAIVKKLQLVTPIKSSKQNWVEDTFIKSITVIQNKRTLATFTVMYLSNFPDIIQALSELVISLKNGYQREFAKKYLIEILKTIDHKDTARNNCIQIINGFNKFASIKGHKNKKTLVMKILIDAIKHFTFNWDHFPEIMGKFLETIKLKEKQTEFVMDSFMQIATAFNFGFHSWSWDSNCAIDTVQALNDFAIKNNAEYRVYVMSNLMRVVIRNRDSVHNLGNTIRKFLSKERIEQFLNSYSNKIIQYYFNSKLSKNKKSNNTSSREDFQSKLNQALWLLYFSIVCEDERYGDNYDKNLNSLFNGILNFAAEVDYRTMFQLILKVIQLNQLEKSLCVSESKNVAQSIYDAKKTYHKKSFSHVFILSINRAFKTENYIAVSELAKSSLFLLLGHDYDSSLNKQYPINSFNSNLPSNKKMRHLKKEVIFKSGKEKALTNFYNAFYERGQNCFCYDVKGKLANPKEVTPIGTNVTLKLLEHINFHENSVCGINNLLLDFRQYIAIRYATIVQYWMRKNIRVEENSLNVSVCQKAYLPIPVHTFVVNYALNYHMCKEEETNDVSEFLQFTSSYNK